MKTKRFWIVSLALIGLLASETAFVPAQEDPVERFGEIVPSGRYVLRWGMQKGQKFSVEESEEVVAENDTPSGTSMTMTISSEWEVTESDEEFLTLLQTIRNLKMEMDLPSAGKISFEVPGPPHERVIVRIIQANASRFVGSQILLQMDRLGNVKNKEFLERPPAAEAPPAKQPLAKEDLVKNLGRMVSFPATSLALGEKWEIATQSPQANGTLELNTEFSLLELVIDHPRWIKIGVSAKLTSAIKSSAMMVGEQIGEGHIIYDDELALVRDLFVKETIIFQGEDGGKRTTESKKRLKIEPLAISTPTPDGPKTEPPKSAPLSRELGKSDD